MEIKKAELAECKAIYKIVERSISSVYPRYYSREITNFFLKLHSKDNIAQDIKKGNVFFIRENALIIGTGSIKDNHITRLYIDPDFSGQGYGQKLLETLENEVRKDYQKAVLETSLPATIFYEKNGYQMQKHLDYDIGDGYKLVYGLMEKSLGGDESEIKNFL